MLLLREREREKSNLKFWLVDGVEKRGWRIKRKRYVGWTWDKFVKKFFN